MNAANAAKRYWPVLLLAVGFGLWTWLSPKAPRDQSVDVLLGDRAADVEDLTVRYSSPDKEPARQVAFHFTHGSAPRVVHHAPRLPDGDYGVDIELNGTSSVHRSVRLEEGRSTQIHAEEVR